MLPKRVLKGKRLAGHMGNVTVTIQNLEIIEVNTAENYILVSGNVPGPKKSLVIIKEAVKASDEKVSPKEIVVYETKELEPEKEEVVDTKEETVSEETVEKVEETKEETAPEVKEEAKEETPAKEVQEEKEEKQD